MLNQAGPCLILPDEVLAYLSRRWGQDSARARLRGNTLTFLHELTIAVANCPTACMIATLTSQLAEFMDEGANGPYSRWKRRWAGWRRCGRTVKGLRSTRSSAAGCSRTWATRPSIGRRPSLLADLPGTWGGRALALPEPSYRDGIVRAYPFHPEMISGLYEGPVAGTIPEFQRTRGVLRLLADVISNLYQEKDNEVLTVHHECMCVSAGESPAWEGSLAQ